MKGRMTTEARGTGEGTFGQRCLIAAAADARACWEEYIALVYAAAEGQPHDAGGNRRAEMREQLHQVRTALITAVTVRRAAADEFDAERDDDEDDDDDRP